jgi:hypothetical protein
MVAELERSLEDSQLTARCSDAKCHQRPKDRAQPNQAPRTPPIAEPMYEALHYCQQGHSGCGCQVTPPSGTIARPSTSPAAACYRLRGAGASSGRHAGRPTRDRSRRDIRAESAEQGRPPAEPVGKGGTAIAAVTPDPKVLPVNQ